MIELFTTGSPAHYLGILVTLLVAILGSIHALLHKRDPRSAVLWLGIIWFVPLVGVCLYLLLGVNRIRRRALSLRAGLEHVRSRGSTHECTPEQIEAMLPVQHQYLHVLAASGTRIIERPLVSGNQITVLRNGDEAYPAMLDAIRNARTSIALSSYIFDSDSVGMEFVKALAEAVRRGVAVRVLVDATGTWYSWPPIQRALRDSQVPYARFLPAFSLWRLPSINLRNHRKILVVDGQTGFTGGMNIRAGHWLSRNPSHPVQDLHFRVAGPVVSHLQEVFAEDWRFTTGETLEGPPWFPAIDSRGSVISRGVADGPDEDVDPMRWTFLAAISAAKSSIRIATPYFLPDATLISALNLAAMRGVRVQILLPSKSNLPFVHWASRAHWWQFLERGCRLWLSPSPFDHSKVFVVDEAWVTIGSTNWDPRSLRLNFEFNLECYCPDLGGGLSRWFDERLAHAEEVSLADVDARGLPIRLLDGVARLFTPYL